MAMALQQARTNVRWASGLDMLAGLWMIAAPFLLGYAGVATAMWNSVLIGAAIALLAGSREVGEGYRYAMPSWINLLLGAWLVISPFALGFGAVPVAFWNHVIVGLAVVAFAMWGALSTPHEEHDRR